MKTKTYMQWLFVGRNPTKKEAATDPVWLLLPR